MPERKLTGQLVKYGLFFQQKYCLVHTHGEIHYLFVDYLPGTDSEVGCANHLQCIIGGVVRAHFSCSTSYVSSAHKELRVYLRRCFEFSWIHLFLLIFPCFHVSKAISSDNRRTVTNFIARFLKTEFDVEPWQFYKTLYSCTNTWYLSERY